jgi:excisionase family DNA binding protein
MQELTVRVEEAARRLDIGRTQVFGLIRSGELQSIQVGRRRLIPVKALEDWLANQMANATRTEPAQANGDGLKSASERVTDSPLVGLREVV